jgi:hypothetical protein
MKRALPERMFRRSGYRFADKNMREIDNVLGPFNHEARTVETGRRHDLPLA